MASAVAIRCDELTDDLARFEVITVKCHQCDEDNPRAVPQEKCTECQGTGRSRIKLVGIEGSAGGEDRPPPGRPLPGRRALPGVLTSLLLNLGSDLGGSPRCVREATR